MASLSFSPSLLDILSLVDHKDILNCSLVNRRIHDVISLKRRILPRLWAQISFEFLTDKKQTNLVKIKLMMSSTASSVSFIASKQQMEICAADNTSCILNQCICKYDKRGRFIFFGGEKMNWAYQVNGLEEGLNGLLPLIFERYNFTSISLKSDGPYLPSTLCQLIAGIKRGSLSQCVHLNMDTLYSKEWNEIGNLFDSSSMRVRSSSLSDLAPFLSTLSTWSREMVFKTDSHFQLDSFRHIINVIQKWQSGSININFLKIAPKRRLGPDQRSINVLKALGRLEYVKKCSSYDCVYLLFERSKDQRILSLTFSKRNQRLAMFDYIQPTEKY